MQNFAKVFCHKKSFSTNEFLDFSGNFCCFEGFREIRRTNRSDTGSNPWPGKNGTNLDLPLLMFQLFFK